MERKPNVSKHGSPREAKEGSTIHIIPRSGPKSPVPGFPRSPRSPSTGKTDRVFLEVPSPIPGSRRRGTMPDFRQIVRVGMARQTSHDNFTVLLRNVRKKRSQSIGDPDRHARWGTRATRGSLSTRSESFSSDLPRLVDREQLQLKWTLSIQIVLALTKLYSRVQKSIWENARFAEQMKTVDQSTLDDTDQFMLFDPASFKANRQMRMTPEVRRILTEAPDSRDEQGVYYAMIALRGIEQIADYPVRMQRKLAKYGRFESYEPGRVIVKQDRTPEAFYFILYGSVLVAVTEGDPPQVNTKCFLHRGDSFGELAIMHQYERQSTVISKTYVEMLSIDVQTYEKTFMAGGTRNINDPDHHDFLQSLDFLRGWPLEMLEDQPDNVIFCYFKRGSVMVKDSNCSDWIYIVKSGSARVLKKLVKMTATVSARTGRQIPTLVPTERRIRHWLQGNVPPEPPHISMDDVFPSTQETEVYEDDLSSTTWRLSAALRAQSAVTRLSKERRGIIQTANHGYRSTLPRGGDTVRPAHSAFPNASSQRRACVTDDRRRKLKTAPAVSTEPLGPEDVGGHEHDVKFREERRTFADDLDCGYNSMSHVTTEADRNPVFVVVQTLTKGGVFGLTAAVFRDQPGMCLVSNGAECIMINKSLYQQHCPKRLMQKLKTRMSPYPTDESLQNNLLTRLNWDNFKMATFYQVMEDRRAVLTSQSH